MKSSFYRGAATLGAMIVLAMSNRSSEGQITGIVDSDVEGFFGTTNDTFQQTETPNNAIPPTSTASARRLHRR